ncbi:uncharacterized protein LOC131691364 [Topomyia yanbarensis]|uniref:uncharacterized protein LOC131691364 n=1 Tax=Topomyia yanbarensis TaxID=2498891 RepID=UPI00273C48C7|nr:uncharacterized protein LOC131691364 [Topomyia yanbarensis]
MIFRVSEQLILVLGFLIKLTFCAKLQATNGDSRPVLRNFNSNICPPPSFPNGMQFIRMRGKFMLFNCFEGFILVGEKYLFCKNGRWDSPAPICVKPGCSKLPPVDSERGFIFYEHEKASATIFCNSGYQPVGSLYSYCNGSHWDRLIGRCQLTDSAVSTSCDFEVVDWCGWTNDAMLALGWKRSSGIISTRALKTGPTHDHTTGVSLNGHFMMIDSTEQFTNTIARLISPIYSASYSTDGCFLFYYHMYGDSVGKLAIYVKPILSALLPNSSFSISGNQGNSWKEGHFVVPQQTSSFQIVIEASQGTRYKSDIAIDDVSLTIGQRCPETAEEISATTEIVNEEVIRLDSCQNRCSLNASYVRADAVQQNVIRCGCTEKCLDSDSCCLDFFEWCVVKERSSTSESEAQMTTGWFSTDVDEQQSVEEYSSSVSFEAATIRAKQSEEISESGAYLIMITGFFSIVVGLILIRLRKSCMLRRKTKERSVNFMETIQFLAINEDIEHDQCIDDIPWTT